MIMPNRTTSYVCPTHGVFQVSLTDKDAPRAEWMCPVCSAMSKHVSLTDMFRGTRFMAKAVKK